MTNPKKLFISYSHLAITLEDQQDGGKWSITQGDLDTGLYAFGCTRECVFEDLDKYVEDYASRGSSVAKAAVAKAEREGRVTWRPIESTSGMPIAQVNALLCQNGYTVQLKGSEEHSGSYTSVNYIWRTRTAVNAYNSQLEGVLVIEG